MFGNAETESLTERQRAVLQVVVAHVGDQGYPPTVREICDAVGLASPSTVHAHLAALERAGLIERDPTKPRALKLSFDPTPGATEPATPKLPAGVTKGIKPASVLSSADASLGTDPRGAVSLPVLGRVAAGPPILAEQRFEGSVSVPHHLVRSGTSFVVDIRGDSMEGIGILDGDQVVVRAQPEAQDGQIVIALIDGEATCKRLRTGKHGIELHAENPAYPPIRSADASVVGIVTGVVRAL